MLPNVALPKGSVAIIFWLLVVYFTWELSLHEITCKHVQDFNLFLLIYKQKRERCLCCRKWWSMHKRAHLSERFFSVFIGGDDAWYVSLGCVLALRDERFWQGAMQTVSGKYFRCFQLKILNLFNVMCSSSSTRKQYYTLHMVVVILHSMILS